MFKILQEYNHKPYYKLYDDYISIKDDTMCRIVSFKLFQQNCELITTFNEAWQTYTSNTPRHITKIYYNWKISKLNGLITVILIISFQI